MSNHNHRRQGLPPSSSSSSSSSQSGSQDKSNGGIININSTPNNENIISPSKRKETIRIGEYALGDKIGKGAYGQVYKGLNSKTGDFVAIKQIDRIKIDANTLQSVKSEVEILQKLNHNNIVKVLGCVESQSQLNFILEYVENGSLRDVVEKFGPLSEELATVYLYQLLQGLAYLHQHRIIHRDIKCSNILITKEGVIKLADFGVASQLSDEVQLRYSVVGTPYWMAPEAITISGQSSSSDIWSLGCTMIELITGHPPYYNLQPMSAMFKIVQDPHPPYPPNISKQFEDFLNVSFEKDPNKRPTAAELLRHPLFKTNQSGQLPTLSELQDTLKTLNNKSKPVRGSVASIDWTGSTNSISNSSSSSSSSNHSNGNHHPNNNNNHLHNSSGGGSGKSTPSPSPSTSLNNSRNEESEEISKLQLLVQHQQQTIFTLSEEIASLKKQLKDNPFMEEQQFYREFFMALAISVKVNQCYLGKNYEQVNIQSLYESARSQDIPWYSLIEWIPKQIIIKEAEENHNNNNNSSNGHKKTSSNSSSSSSTGSRLSKAFGIFSSSSNDKDKSNTNNNNTTNQSISLSSSNDKNNNTSTSSPHK